MKEKAPIIYGLSPVIEAVRSEKRSINKIIVARNLKTGRVQELIALARRRGIPIHFAPREALNRLAHEAKHQGVIAHLAAYPYADADEILNALRPDSLLVLLDEVEDPRNLGAIIRTAHGAGAEAVVIPQRRTAGLTEAAAKTSAGAIEHTSVARVTNLVSFMRALKERGVKMIGVEAEGKTAYTDCQYSGPIAFVFGSEGTGLRRLTKETCDLIVSIPMKGRVSSLNVSVAVGVVLFEVLRQRSHS